MIVQVENGGLRIACASSATRRPRRTARCGSLLTAYHDRVHGAGVAVGGAATACTGWCSGAARWLLMIRDRVGSDDLRLTHEYLAIMLAARRASVTEALRPLQEAGLVRSHRGRITILDGAALEARCVRVLLRRAGRIRPVAGSGDMILSHRNQFVK